MTSNNLFWFLAGAMTALAGCLIAFPLLRTTVSGGAGRARNVALAAVCVLAVAIAAVAIYSRVGSPAAVGGSATATAGATGVGATGLAADAQGPGRPAAQAAQAGSMEAAVARLAERLARGGGSDADWSLLAQSYEFMGRKDDAARAREHKLPAAGGLPAPGGAVVAGAAVPDTAGLEARVARDPRDGKAWLALAEARRESRDTDGALKAFGRAAALGPMTADGWADYADVLAGAAGGKLAGRPADAIRRALALDAHHPKALWLDASLALEQRDYRAALARWKLLRAALPADSPDVRVVDSNIAEAEQLAGIPASAGSGAAPMPPATGGADAQVSGTVDLADGLRAKVTPGMTLFIYAKSPDSPGPPLAVLRTVVGSWPVRFTLDDSMAMMAARKLSNFDSVIVEARVSRSGNAIAAAGDLVATSPAIRPRDRRPVALTISREVS